MGKDFTTEDSRMNRKNLTIDGAHGLDITDDFPGI